MSLNIKLVGGACAAFALLAACATGADPDSLPPVEAASPPIASPETYGTSVQRTLIPREVFFGNPEKASAQLSPDGSKLSWVAPVDGVLNVWTSPADDMSAGTPLTKDTGRGIRSYTWAGNGTHLIYIQDKGGDENFRAYSVNVETGEETNLTPMEGVRVVFFDTSWDAPDAIMLGINDRDPRWHDVYRVNVVTGERELIYENKDEIASFYFDDAFNLRAGTVSNPDASVTVLRRQGEAWDRMFTWDYADTWSSQIIGVDETNEGLYAIDSLGRDKAAIIRIDLETGVRTILGRSDQADVSSIITDPDTGALEAYSVNYLRNEWTFSDQQVAAEYAWLQSQLPGDVFITDRTRDDSTWLVVSSAPEAPGVSYLYTPETKTLTKLFASRPELDNFQLLPMEPVEITSRDGLTLVSYLTIPAGTDTDNDGRPDSPVPMVLAVHGGPWARDGYGYNTWHQWLGDRGYAVLSVNFRGSTGFGKSFVTAGDMQWGRKMQDDLLDAVDWAVAEGITEDDTVAIAGGSYGGYATLAGLAFTPEEFACGVDIVGPSNLETLLNSVPPYWASFFNALVRAMGDPRTEEGRALLKERSPLTKASDIRRPLLIAQGANDPRVKQAESDQIVDAMKAQGIPVTYILFPDEGHGFARPENNLAFYSVMESFLAGCLGGRYEPIGEAFKGSSLTVVHGAEYAPGLEEALEGHTPETRG